MSIKETIKSNPKIKKLVHWMLFPRFQARPRLWVRLFINPFYHKRGANTIIRSSARMDVIPYNKFEIGKESIIEDFCTINNGVGDVFIGDESRIGLSNVIIGPVKIGNSVILAQNIVVSGLNHTYEEINIPIRFQKVSTSPIVIEDEVWIGANSVITSGITIGKHSVIAAGAIVTKDIPAYSIAVGNPARIVKKYNFNSGLWEKVS